MSKILITGGAGFIGSHLVDELLDCGHDVIVVDNLSTGSRANLPSDVTLYEIDILDEGLNDVFEREKPDYVFHLAALTSVPESFKEPEKYFRVNVEGSLKVLKCCKNYKVQKIIFSSTAAVYSPDAKVPICENAALEPLSPYGLSKKIIEEYCKEYKEISGLEYVILRYANVYGPRQQHSPESGVITIFINSLINGKSITIFNDGGQTRDFIFVKDVAQANILALQKEGSGIFNISTATEISINKLAESIHTHLASDLSPRYNCNLRKKRTTKKFTGQRASEGRNGI